METESDLLVLNRSFDALNEKLGAIESSLKAVKENIEKLASSYARFDYKTTKVNGFRIVIQTTARLLEFLNSEAKFDQERTLKVLKFLEWFSSNAVECLHRANGNDLNTLSPESHINAVDNLLAMREELRVIRFELGQMIFAGDISPQVSKMQTLLPLLSAPTFGSFVGACFSSSIAKQNMLMEKSLSGNYCDIIANLRSITNHPITSNLGKFATFLKYKDIQRRDVILNGASSFMYKLEDTNVILEESNAKPMRPTRCRLLQAQNPPNSNLDLSTKDVLLFVHGGAFVLLTPERSEPVLVEFARQLGPKVALLVVDYRLAPEGRFPAALQDVLDTFLWLKNSKDEETEKELGFRVGKVLVAGESAGSCLAASMICSLSDAKRKWPEKNFFLPDGFLSIVGVFSASFQAYPSTLLSALDMVFHPWERLLISFGGYSPFEPEKESYASGKELLESAHLGKFLQLSSHPYMSPLFYAGFENLKDLPLSLVTSTTCPIADHSVGMAKKWKGPVQLVALERLPHAFFGFQAESSRKGIQICINETKRLFNCS